MPDISQVGYRNRRDTKVHTGASRVRRYNIQGERWPTSNITWSLRRPSPHLKAEPLRRELAAALKMWSQESSLVFEELTEPEEAKGASIQGRYILSDVEYQFWVCKIRIAFSQRRPG